MASTVDKRDKEKELVSLMISIYCRRKHKTRGGLCASCKELESYAGLRSEKCPHIETKTFCSSCHTHCYKPEMRARIKEVMRFSGPRLMLHHPIVVLRHMMDTMAERRKKKKEE